MRLFEAIHAAHQRLVAGEKEVALPLEQFSSSLPVAALTCIDPRLNHLLPDALGIFEKDFIWLRNAGNIITAPLSSTMRSLALACAVKGAKEIVVIGHSDCLICKTSALQLLDRLAGLGVDRQRIPENLVEYFGLFASERQNVIRGVEIIRASPLIGARVPVHGMLLDLETGRLEWVVNGYQTLGAVLPGKTGELVAKADQALESLARIGNIAAGELKFPTTKIGEIVSTAHDWVHTAGKVAAAVESRIGAPAKAPVSSESPPLLGGTSHALGKLRVVPHVARNPKSTPHR